MSKPITLQFGPWAPDLANVSMQLPYYPGEITPVPCADTLNVYYQDGAYRSIPGPHSIGPAAASQILNAFTWYDTSTGNELVFAGSIDSISELVGGAWSLVPIGGVAPTSFGMRLSQGKPKFSPLLQASLTVGNFSTNYGYQSGSYGSLVLSTDTNGNTVTGLNWSAHHPPPANTTTLIYGTAFLGASYFTQLTIPSLSVTLTSSSATYSTYGEVSQWSWTGGQTPTSGSYAIVIT